jgi:sugar phosphate isomerase/epimerase
MFKNFSAEALGISGRPSEIIELALSYGFKGLDLDLVDFAQQVETQGIGKASRLIASARLKIGGVRLPVRWQEDAPEYQADLAHLAKLAPIAQQLGCTRAFTTVEPGHDTRVYHENFEFHRRRLAEMAGTLAPHKIHLGVGFLAPLACRAGRAFQFIQTFDELLLLIRNVGAANVGVALDVWHWHLGGGKIDQLASLPADKIVAVWLADAPADTTAATAQLDARLWPSDDGVIDSAAVLKTLAQSRYDGPVTPSPDRSQLAGLSRDAIVKQAGASLDRVWTAAGLARPAGKSAAVHGR